MSKTPASTTAAEIRWISILACRLRAKQAMQKLATDGHDQPSLSDTELVARYLWRCAINSSLVCFFIAPAVMLLIGAIFPAPVQAFLWFAIKLCMAVACIVIACAMRLTFNLHSQQ